MLAVPRALDISHCVQTSTLAFVSRSTWISSLYPSHQLRKYPSLDVTSWSRTCIRVSHTESLLVPYSRKSTRVYLGERTREAIIGRMIFAIPEATHTPRIPLYDHRRWLRGGTQRASSLHSAIKSDTDYTLLTSWPQCYLADQAVSDSHLYADGSSVEHVSGPLDDPSRSV